MNHDVTPGWYTLLPEERRIVERLLWFAPGAALVEIGAYTGQTTRHVMLAALQAAYGMKTLHVIDPWDGAQDASDDEAYREFCKTVGVEPSSTLVTTYRVGDSHRAAPMIVHRARSQDVTPPPDLGFVLEDGDHRNPDFQRWYDALVPGGILVVHDVDDPGWPAVAREAARLPKPCYRFRVERAATENDPYGPGLRGLAWWIKP